MTLHFSLVVYDKKINIPGFDAARVRSFLFLIGLVQTRLRPWRVLNGGRVMIYCWTMAEVQVLQGLWWGLVDYDLRGPVGGSCRYMRRGMKAAQGWRVRVYNWSGKLGGMLGRLTRKLL